MKFTEFDMKPQKNEVLSLIECYPESELYEDIVEEYEELLPLVSDIAKPLVLLEFGYLPEIEEVVLFSLSTVGKEVVEMATNYFAEGDYLKGMLVDAIADNYLFQLDEQMKVHIVNLCREKQKGIRIRLEAPQQISMEAQKVAWEVTHAEHYGIGITSACMYNPVKSMCQIYVLDDVASRYNIQHDCSKCPSLNCKARKIQSYNITIAGKNEEVITANPEKSILKNLQQYGIYINAPCGGRGSCGKCVIRCIDGWLEITEPDRRFLKESQLELGYRLACYAYIKSDIVISLESLKEDEFEILTNQSAKQLINNAENELCESRKNLTKQYGIVADIGTTTIVMQLIDLENGELIDTFATINKQRSYGADVIARIEASNRGEGVALQSSIKSQLLEGIDVLIGDEEIDIQKMAIAGNTTMIHLLMGYDCKTLGVAPFKPVDIHTISTFYKEFFENDTRSFPIQILPSLSAFVGGDIMAGLLAVDVINKDEISIFIDLGTNGEMAIGNKDKILATSVAAGPAFEGGNISSGIGSVSGAICQVNIEKDHIQCKTIQDKSPIGICGTGVLELVYELLESDWMDETGRLEEKFEDGILLSISEEGNEIIFTQKDVREIQLAKSAVRSGIETLMIRYEIEPEKIDKVYVAGGFGVNLDLEKAIGIGLFPKSLENKIVMIGNACLKGLIEVVKNNSIKAVEKIVEISTEIDLSRDKDFNELYMDYMYFEAE